jgi:hypothetical protein
MYCPVCLNDTLKIASSGVVKLTFDGKAKSTTQFYYNLKEETPINLNKKLRNVVRDYFQYYSEFQNKNTIKEVYAFSSDFRCANGCAMSLEKKFNILDLVIDKDDFFNILDEEAEVYELEINLNKIKAANQA